MENLKLTQNKNAYSSPAFNHYQQFTISFFFFLKIGAVFCFCNLLEWHIVIFCNSWPSCHFSAIILKHKPRPVTGLPKIFLCPSKPTEGLQTLCCALTGLGFPAACCFSYFLHPLLTPCFS